MVCPNPNCGRIHENVHGKCPHCGSDFHGHVGGKRAVKPRDVVSRFKCGHDILLHWPCPKCEREGEECEVYRQSLLAKLKELLIYRGINKSEAWERAKKLLAAIDPTEAQKGTPST